VIGTLLCGDSPAVGVRVKLIDDDFEQDICTVFGGIYSTVFAIDKYNMVTINTNVYKLSGPDPDDELDAGYTDEKGHFDLSGDTTEMTTIDPHLKIYHDCNDGITPCQRRWKFELPNHYITGGRMPQKTLNIGTWNLEAKLPDESHDCIH
ncbi:unnamed protein product, partial [Toxocara canis]|uniref:Transthyretin-like family protein n=1 Tax=Toxocara canis TaxID=6265 RepID=A0A183UWK3_TOXCA